MPSLEMAPMGAVLCRRIGVQSGHGVGFYLGIELARGWLSRTRLNSMCSTVLEINTLGCRLGFLLGDDLVFGFDPALCTATEWVVWFVDDRDDDLAVDDDVSLFCFAVLLVVLDRQTGYRAAHRQTVANWQQIGQSPQIF
jgi:hypothetical protein